MTKLTLKDLLPLGGFVSEGDNDHKFVFDDSCQSALLEKNSLYYSIKDNVVSYSRAAGYTFASMFL
ncbi:hypothetical protein HN747_03940 [archaeon]|jgi:hypothetical protein|nr:hypothetical protein [archaeon]